MRARVGKSSVLGWNKSLLVCFVCPLSVAMDGGRYFMSSSIRLFHVAKYHLLMTYKMVWWTGINIVAWYHWASSGLVTAARAFGDSCLVDIGWLHGLLVRLTFHIPYVSDWCPSIISRMFFITLSFLEVKYSMHLSYQSFHM